MTFIRTATFTTTAIRTAVFIMAFCVCQTARADIASRIAEILTRDNMTKDGVVDTRMTGSVDGCVIRLTLDRLDACSRGASFGKTEKLIDIRVLITGKEDVKVKDFTGTINESPGASVRYSYRWPFRQLLESAGNARSEILQEEYARYPEDVASRLRSLSKRYREEINPRLYAHSMKTTFYCSGVEIAAPLSGPSFGFHLRPEHAGELVNLIERYASQCEPGSTSQKSSG